MIPIYIICAVLLLIFLVIINKTREGMELFEIAHIAQVFVDKELLTVEKIDKLNDKIRDKFITDPEILATMETPDLSDTLKLEKIYGMSVDMLFNQRMTAPSVYSSYTIDQKLNSTEFINILNILYDETNEDPTTKINLIKAMQIKDRELLAIVDNATLSDNVKLFGKELDGDEIITIDTIEQNLMNPPQIPQQSSNKKGKKGKKGDNNKKKKK
jgi:hypothetical protein